MTATRLRNPTPRLLVTAALAVVASHAAAQPLAIPMPGGEVAYWSEQSTPLAQSESLAQPESMAGGDEAGGAYYDSHVEPVQLGLGFALSRSAAIATQSQVGGRQRARAAARTAGGIGLASIPFMIGDTGAGTCLAFGGLLTYDLSHPTLTCSRLNISENNTPLPTNRLYHSYRHFHNAAGVRNFQFEEQFNTERFTLGAEKTFWGGLGSIELRQPFEHRLASEFLTVNAAGFGTDLVFTDDGNDSRLELANTSAILKFLLVERRRFALSAGLGVTAPTAQDVEVQLGINTLVTFPDVPLLFQVTTATYEMDFSNETVYLSPFLSWAYTPGGRWFHQGFLQIEVPLNPSNLNISGLSTNTFFVGTTPTAFFDFEVNPPANIDIFAQTLMRLNLGLGYVLVDRPDTRLGLRLTGLAELHYTTTLEDAELTAVPLTVTASGGGPPLQAIVVGNLDNRVDILNAAAGVSADLGNWTVTNGFVAPLREDPDRGFDFEYNLQVQRVF